ncbi:MAG: DUF2892 domain-containing protein [Ignavibacteria bacterium]
MIKNMGSVDRIVRTIAAIVIVILLLTGALEGVVATILGILAIVFLGTSAVGFCPLYAPFKISTKKQQ